MDYSFTVKTFESGELSFVSLKEGEDPFIILPGGKVPIHFVEDRDNYSSPNFEPSNKFFDYLVECHRIVMSYNYINEKSKDYHIDELINIETPHFPKLPKYENMVISFLFDHLLGYVMGECKLSRKMKRLFSHAYNLNGEKIPEIFEVDSFEIRNLKEHKSVLDITENEVGYSVYVEKSPYNMQDLISDIEEFGYTPTIGDIEDNEII